MLSLLLHCIRVSAVWEGERERERERESRSTGKGEGEGEGKGKRQCKRGIGIGIGIGRDSKGACYLALENMLADSIQGLIALHTHKHTPTHTHTQSSPPSQSSTLKTKMWNDAYEGNVRKDAFNISDIKCSLMSPRKRKVMLKMLAARNPVQGPHQVMRCTILHYTALRYTALYYTTIHCPVLSCTTLCCTTLQ